VSDLPSKIAARTATVAVMGLGYVGLPLAVEAAAAGLRTVGLDLDEAKVSSIQAGRSYIPDVESEQVHQLVADGLLTATTCPQVLADADAIIICVPTPLRKTREPDISAIVAASERIASHLRPGSLVVLESTTYPGTTEEVLLPMFQAGGMKVGTDFFLAFSPERVDPGNKQYNTRTITKIVGGVTPTCTEMALALYRTFIANVVPVSSAKVAETAKLLENTFRSVNIALVNELSLMCRHLGVDVWEVIQAASTKPFGFVPHYPGPGIGGHCIPLDPFYLSWKARIHGYEARFIGLAGEINSSMPRHVVSLVSDALNAHRKCVNGSRVLVLGAAYKRDVGDTRESPALEIISMLAQRGANVRYNDPYVPSVSADGVELRSVPLTAAEVSLADCVVIVTDHSAYDYHWLVANANLVVDTRNATAAVREGREKIVKL
jgi:UDP-N-acetyl-D-glucosamine dehydrogenase